METRSIHPCLTQNSRISRVFLRGQKSQWQFPWEHEVGDWLFWDAGKAWTGSVTLLCPFLNSHWTGHYLLCMYSTPRLIDNHCQQGGCPPAWKVQGSSSLSSVVSPGANGNRHVVRGQGLLRCSARRYVRTSQLAGFLREERIEKKISKFS